MSRKDEARDAGLLLITALGGLAATFVVRSLLDRLTAQNEAATAACFGALAYILVTAYMIAKARPFHRHELRALSVALAVAIGQVAVCALLMVSGMLPVPTSMVPYIIGTAILGPIPVLCFEFLAGRSIPLDEDSPT